MEKYFIYKTEDCSICNGDGRLSKDRKIEIYGAALVDQNICPHCSATGKLFVKTELTKEIIEKIIDKFL